MLSATILSTALVGGLSAAPAQALPSYNCDSPSYWDAWYEAREMPHTIVNEGGSRNVILRLHQARIEDLTFAELTGATRAGDQAWVEWKDDAGRWVRPCAKGIIGSSVGTVTTKGPDIADGVKATYRACLSYPVYSNWSTVCTSAWTG